MRLITLQRYSELINHVVNNISYNRMLRIANHTITENTTLATGWFDVLRNNFKFRSKTLDLFIIAKHGTEYMISHLCFCNVNEYFYVFANVLLIFFYFFNIRFQTPHLMLITIITRLFGYVHDRKL